MKIVNYIKPTDASLFIICSILQLYVFKYAYPNADFTFTSSGYLEAAIFNIDFSLWPIGYSKFLFLTHEISHTDTIVVASQYAILQTSAFILFITLKRLYQPPSHITNALFLVLILNPFSLYVSNYILPDALFSAISLLWVASLITLTNKSTAIHAVWHAISLALLLLLKTQGLFYPFVSVIVILSMTRPRRVKVLALSFTVAATLATVELIQETARKETGRRQLSPIISWQVANNALYGYPAIDSEKLIVRSDTGQLNTRIELYFKNNNTLFTPFHGSAYLYAYVSPLRQYWLEYVLRNKSATETEGWCQLAPTVSAWGIAVIRSSPGDYTKHYLVPNMANYFFPLTREIARYNAGEKDVAVAIKEWFSYPSTTIACRFPELQNKIFIFFSAMFLVTNIIITIGIVFLMVKKTTPSGDVNTWKNLFLLSSIFYTVNACFSIILQPVDLTSMTFPNTLYPCLILIALSLLTTSESRPATGLPA